MLSALAAQSIDHRSESYFRWSSHELFKYSSFLSLLIILIILHATSWATRMGALFLLKICYISFRKYRNWILNPKIYKSTALEYQYYCLVSSIQVCKVIMTSKWNQFVYQGKLLYSKEITQKNDLIFMIMTVYGSCIHFKGLIVIINYTTEVLIHVYIHKWSHNHIVITCIHLLIILTRSSTGLQQTLYQPLSK